MVRVPARIADMTRWLVLFGLPKYMQKPTVMIAPVTSTPHRKSGISCSVLSRRAERRSASLSSR